MRLSKDLLNKAIVTIDDGSIVGHVKDIYLNADLSEMAGIHLKKEGLFRRRALLIPAHSVVVFGIDVVLINSIQSVSDDKKLVEAASWILLDKLQGREVDTPGGTRVGTIGDVVLDEEGMVTGYALSRVLVEGPIAETRVIDRGAVLNVGNSKEGIMTIDLNRAERPDAAIEASQTAEEALAALEDSVDESVLNEVDAKEEALSEIESAIGQSTASDSAEATNILDDILSSQNPKSSQ